MASPTLEQSYDDYEHAEQAFLDALDESLQPRGPDFLYGVIGGLGLPRGARVLDVGCGKGQQSVRLARQFGFSVTGIDPVALHVEMSNEALLAAAEMQPELSDLVRFEPGVAESLPVDDGSIDLILCREMLYHVELPRTFAKCRRVLRPGGRLVIYQIFGTGTLEPREAAWLWGPQGVTATNADPKYLERAATEAGFAIDERILLSSEVGELQEEQSGAVGRHLLHAARLLRAPERYIERFGQSNYDIKLGDAFWHVYRMIGKLSTRIYVLRAP